MRKNKWMVYTALLIMGVLLLAGCAKNGNGGANGGKAEPKADVVAKVNDTELTRQQLDKEISRVAARYEAQYGFKMADIPEDQRGVMEKELEKAALQSMIDAELLKQFVQKKGIDVPDEDVDQKFAEYKNQYENEEEFNAAMEQADITEEELKKQVSMQLAQQELFEQLTADVQLPDDETVLKVRHILINAEEGKATEEQTAQAREKAEQLIKQLEEGADFATLAKENSDDPGSAANGGLLDMYFTKDDSRLVQPFVEGAFALGQTGSFSKEPVQSRFGFHIIKVEEVKKYGELEADVAEELAAPVKNKVFTEQFEQFKATAKVEKSIG